MTPRQESSILKEMGRIYQNCEDRIATYTRWRWIATGISWISIFVAFLLGTAKLASPIICLLLALLGGYAGGFAILFGAAAKQLPLWIGYTTLREPEAQKRLEELTDV
jgi:hypothetical protein